MISKENLEGLAKGDVVELTYIGGPRDLCSEHTEIFYFVEVVKMDNGVETVGVTQEKTPRGGYTKVIPIDRIEKIQKY